MLSVQAVSWALRDDLPRTRLTEKDARGVSLPIAQLVLVVLAEHAGPDGRGAFPSVPTIAREGRLAERTVHKALRALEDAGVIQRDGTGPRGSTRWRLPVGGAHGAGVHDVQGCTPDTRGVHDVQATPAPRAPEPSLTVIPTGTTTTTSPAATGDVSRVFAEWQESTGKTRAVLDTKRKRIIRDALKLYDVEDLVDAVKGWRLSPHHRGENDRRTVYNELHLLIGDAERVEKFRDLTRGAGSQANATSAATSGAGIPVWASGAVPEADPAVVASATRYALGRLRSDQRTVRGVRFIAVTDPYDPFGLGDELRERIRATEFTDDASRMERLANRLAPVGDDVREGEAA